MNTYEQFLETKKRTAIKSGFNVELNELPDYLFPFQKFCVQRALSHGKYAIFSGTGSGKSFMSITWANKVSNHTNKPVLILTNLAISAQFIKEGKKFGILVQRLKDALPEWAGGNNDLFNCDQGVYVCNYEQLDAIVDYIPLFAGVVCDESSILANHEGKTKAKLIEYFVNTPYKLCASATPSPNSPMEIGNHAEFLDVMNRNEMLAMFFIHDGGNTSQWRLKGHAEDRFYEWMASWCVMFDRPGDIGFDNTGYDLPPLNINEIFIPVPLRDNGLLFNNTAVNATSYNAELRLTMEGRMNKTVEIATDRSNKGEDVLIWIKHNEEGRVLRSLLPNAKEISGSDKDEQKELLISWFTDNQCICHTVKKNKENTINNGINEINLKEKNITNNGLPIIATGLKNITKKINQNETQIDEKNISLRKNTENIKNNSPEFIQQEHLTNGLTTDLSEITELPLNNITNCEINKSLNAQYAEEYQNKAVLNTDCTLTIVTTQEESEDCCALNAITELENLKTTSRISSEQLCICGANKRGKILISKTKILGMGINMQNCNNEIFASPDFSFRDLYQGIRRIWRFGQKEECNIWILLTETMQNIGKLLKEKGKSFKTMLDKITKHVNANMNEDFLDKQYFDTNEEKNEYYHIKRGDCVQLIKGIPDESIGFSIWSPPFASLYTYSDHIEDMGNCTDHVQFMEQFKFLVKDLYRVMKSGRNVAVHCMDLPIQKGKEGYIGLRDFSGMILNAFQDVGFIYHSRCTLWKDPVVEMQRTKALGLLHKQVKKDAAMSRVGIPDYLLIFRKPGESNDPVIHQDKDASNPNYLPVEKWQQIASPVWMDIDYSDTLQFRTAREEKDERHIAPLQLQTIERAVFLYSNPGDTVLTTFAGIGSEVWQSVKMGRYGIGFELKASYYELMKENMRKLVNEMNRPTLFDI